jgi:hypothetical protein
MQAMLNSYTGWPLVFTRWEEQAPAIRSLHLQGLSEEASRQLLSVYGLTGSTYQTLARHYAGNPEEFLAAKSWICAD